MPVTYTVSNVGQNYESPPRSQQEPGYYEPVNKSPYQNQNYYGPINKSPHNNQDQGYYEPVYRGPYQDQGYYGPINRGSHQDQGYYRPINKGYYQDQTYYQPIKRSPYQNEGYNNGPTNRSPYYQDSGYESDNYQNYAQHTRHNYYDGYLDPYKSPGHGGHVINNPPQPYMPVLKEQSQISEIIEWKETPEAHVYKAYLPGVKRDDVEVEVEEDIGKVLNIKFYKGEEYSGQHVQEVHSIMLPDNANTGQVKANMENGLLTVSVPKLTRSMKAYRMSI